MNGRRHALRAGLAVAAAATLSAAEQAAAQAAPRLVTVGGALTEIAFAIGAGAQVVGSDTTSVYPEAALRTPKVGYQRQLSAEGVLSLRPDVLLATDDAGPPAVVALLRESGLRIEQVPGTHDLAELWRKIDAVGRATGRGTEAAALRRAVEARWQAAAQRVDALRRPMASAPRVLFVLAHGASPQVAGRKTAADAVIALAGGRNVLDGFEGYRPLTAEGAVAAAPDWVLATRQAVDAAGGADAFWRQPGLLATPAGRRGALHAPDALALLGFGPRLPQAVEALAEALAGTRAS